MKIATIFGTRPEMTKLSALFPLLDRHFHHKMFHTGQHYSAELDSKIRADLGLRRPDCRLPRPPGDFGAQAGAILEKLEKWLRKNAPDLVIVQGDTNSALFGALASARLGIPVAHVEAGCRSGNLQTPEEQNRRLIDSIATYFFAADQDAVKNLAKEGKRAWLVGSTGVDAALKNSHQESPVLGRLKLGKGSFALATLHRAENTESRKALSEKLQVLGYTARMIPVVLPLHPRTQAAVRRFGLKIPEGVRITPPLGYRDFLTLLKHCRLALTDSGGIQEEAATFHRPCVVLREETEWMRLVTAGKNFLLPAFGAAQKRILHRLIEDEKFYAKVRKRKAPGMKPGACENILRLLSRIQAP